MRDFALTIMNFALKMRDFEKVGKNFGKGQCTTMLAPYNKNATGPFLFNLVDDPTGGAVYNQPPYHIVCSCG